jgi:hypothetical protein
MGNKRQLVNKYRFPGFRPQARIKGEFGDPKARIIRLERTQKKQYVDVVGKHTEIITTRRYDVSGICRGAIRVIQRRAYGLRDEDYLRLKILTCMPKEI